MKVITNKPCCKCGRLLDMRFVRQLNRMRAIMFCECCKHARHLFDLVSEDDIEELEDGNMILNSETLATEAIMEAAA